MQKNNKATPTTVDNPTGAFLLYTKNPNPIAKNIKRIDAVPERAPVKSSGVCGLYAKVEAQISVKAATTRTNVTQAKTLNSFFPFHLY
ncbi:hypothetical protein CFSAN002369_12119 [Clostridium botulinum CFSAN002369]|nr:hypothetical protein CFSAN002369_12119 [Clostridium botulinum CFSAN002369]